MKNLFLVIPILLCLISCAGQTAQQTAGKTLLAMHDLVSTSAQTADALCKTKVIGHDDCMTLKMSYDKFRQSWPIVDDALIVYLKAPATDNAAATAFNIANSVFIKDYSEMISLLATTGVLKTEVE